MPTLLEPHSQQGSLAGYPPLRNSLFKQGLLVRVILYPSPKQDFVSKALDLLST